MCAHAFSPAHRGRADRGCADRDCGHRGCAHARSRCGGDDRAPGPSGFSRGIWARRRRGGPEATSLSGRSRSGGAGPPPGLWAPGLSTPAPPPPTTWHPRHARSWGRRRGRAGRSRRRRRDPRDLARRSGCDGVPLSRTALSPTPPLRTAPRRACGRSWARGRAVLAVPARRPRPIRDAGPRCRRVSPGRVSPGRVTSWPGKSASPIVRAAGCPRRLPGRRVVRCRVVRCRVLGNRGRERGHRPRGRAGRPVVQLRRGHGGGFAGVAPAVTVVGA